MQSEPSSLATADEHVLRIQLSSAWREGHEENAVVLTTRLANVLLGSSRAREASELCESALNRKIDFRLLHSLGRAQQFSDPPQALATYRRAIGLSSGIDEQSSRELRLERAALLFNCARLCRGSRHAGDADGWLAEADLVVAELDDADGRSASMFARAQYLGEQGKVSDALDLYQQTLILDRQSGLLGSEAAVLLAMGQIYADSGQSAQAVEYYEQALTTARRDENPIHTAAIFRDIGTVYRNHGNASQALSCYETALSIQQHPDTGDSTEAAATLLSRGYVHLAAADLRSADGDFKAAERSLRSRGRSALLAEVWKARGEAARVEGDFSKADHHLRDALELETDLGVLSGKAVTLAQLAVLADQAGLRTAALTYGREAAKAFGQTCRWPELFTALENLSGGSAEPNRSMYSVQASWIALRVAVDTERAYQAIDTLWKVRGPGSELGPLLGAVLRWWSRTRHAEGEIPAQLGFVGGVLLEECRTTRGIAEERSDEWMQKEGLHDHTAFLPRLNARLEELIREQDWLFDRTLAPSLPGL